MRGTVLAHSWCTRQAARVKRKQQSSVCMHVVPAGACMHVVPAGVRALPCLLLKLGCALRLAELHLEAQVPGLEACGAVVIGAFAVVLGELVRRCCADGRRTLWIIVCDIGQRVAGASAHSSSTLARLASSGTYAPTSRGGLVRPASSCARRLARRGRCSTTTRSPSRPCRAAPASGGGAVQRTIVSVKRAGEARPARPGDAHTYT